MAKTKTTTSSNEDVIPPALLPVNIVDDSLTIDRVKKLIQDTRIHDKARCQQWRAYYYTRPTVESFEAFCTDICGTDIMYPDFHRPILANAIGVLGDTYHRHRFTLAFRGSLKSQIQSINYPAWKIACDVINQRGDSTISICLASEGQSLASTHLRAVKGILKSTKFMKLFGSEHGKGKVWTRTELVTGYRSSESEARQKNPTIFTLSLGADRTGYHSDVMIADDLQAFKSSASPEMLDKSWELYGLLFSINNPDGEFVVTGTRWSYTDIYQRIIDESARNRKAEGVVFAPVISPIMDDEENPLYPTRFNKAKIIELKSTSTPFKWASQYLLNPLTDESRRFSISDLRFVDGEIESVLRSNRHYAVVALDPNWVSEESLRSGSADSRAFTVICRFLVDPSGTMYMTHCYRGRPSKLEMCRELWKQWTVDDGHEAIAVGVQQQDYRYLKETFDNYAHETGIWPIFEWISSTSGENNKIDRIEGALEGRVRSHKLYIQRLDWLIAEFYQFPFSKTFDGLDTITNAAKVAKLPGSDEINQVRPGQQAEISETDRHIDRIEHRTGLRKNFRRAY